MFNTSQLFTVLLHLLSGMVGALILQLAFFHPAEKIAIVNITEIVDSFIKETATQSLSPQKMKQQANHFGALLDATLQTVSHKQHLVLLPSEAVVSGALDVTHEVKEKIKAGLKP